MKDTFWFPHDANSADDPKCMILIDQMGLEGYGIFWLLVEKLRSEQNYKLPLMIVPSLAKRYQTSAEKVLTIIQRYDLFKVENEEFFYSQSLLNRMESWENAKRIRSENATKAINARWNNQNNTKELRPYYDSNTNEIRNHTITEENIIKDKTIKKNSKRERENLAEIDKEENTHPPLDFDIDRFFTWYNENTPFSQLIKIEGNRKKNLLARVKEYDKDTIRKTFEKAFQSDFLKGSNERNWKADFDWIIKADNFLKIYEGSYDNNKEKRLTAKDFIV